MGLAVARGIREAALSPSPRLAHPAACPPPCLHPQGPVELGSRLGRSLLLTGPWDLSSSGRSWAGPQALCRSTPALILRALGHVLLGRPIWCASMERFPAVAQLWGDTPPLAPEAYVEGQSLCHILPWIRELWRAWRRLWVGERARCKVRSGCFFPTVPCGAWLGLHGLLVCVLWWPSTLQRRAWLCPGPCLPSWSENL